ILSRLLRRWDRLTDQRKIESSQTIFVLAFRCGSASQEAQLIFEINQSAGVPITPLSGILCGISPVESKLCEPGPGKLRRKLHSSPVKSKSLKTLPISLDS